MLLRNIRRVGLVLWAVLLVVGWKLEDDPTAPYYFEGRIWAVLGFVLLGVTAWMDFHGKIKP
jgi:hypothetical protein